MKLEKCPVCHSGLNEDMVGYNYYLELHGVLNTLRDLEEALDPSNHSNKAVSPEALIARIIISESLGKLHILAEKLRMHDARVQEELGKIHA